MEDKELDTYEVEYSDKYFLHIKKHSSSGQKIVLKKIATLLLEIRNTPTEGTGKVEPLKGYGERSVYSRRIDKKHRLTYEVFEEERRVFILAAYGHYDD